VVLRSQQTALTKTFLEPTSGPVSGLIALSTGHTISVCTMCRAPDMLSMSVYRHESISPRMFTRTFIETAIYQPHLLISHFLYVFGGS
jgi:hypothetical protein